MNLTNGWRILQDVHDLGEALEIYREDFEPGIHTQISDWEPLERLGHLQTILASQPYFGRELRYFNQAPWWYRVEFSAAGGGGSATLRFEGVDYFGKVWLNGHYLGGHEGYSSPFSFEVGAYLRYDRPNLLVVKVSAPWDTEILPRKENSRMWCVVRNMMKGTYEHDDTLIARDVNPVGIWGAVTLAFHGAVVAAGPPRIRAGRPEGRGAALIQASVQVRNDAGPENVTIRSAVYDVDTRAIVAAQQRAAALPQGDSEVEVEMTLENPCLWTTWDRGTPKLYRLETVIVSGEETALVIDSRFGVRSVGIVRTAEETSFILNGDKIFLRGTSYFPDIYLSEMTPARYKRDLDAIKRAGFNAVRIHVHVERSAFYDLCDAMGIAVLQDSDFNWAHPTTQAWEERAAKVFRDMIMLLYNHPAIIGWICLNEPYGGLDSIYTTKTPGPRLLREALHLDPERPVIKSSFCREDPDSGDSHNYLGSLDGEDTHYTDILGTSEKLNTEFGFDAPACWESLRRIPALYRRLRPLGDGLPAIQHYQYRLLKYYIERYRIRKYAPCSGYFQFMFIDLCPQSFYGVYDWWGIPKEGLRALEESNKPLGVFMEYEDAPIAIWVANDLPCGFDHCSLTWSVADRAGTLLHSGKMTMDLPEDSIVRACDLAFAVDTREHYSVCLFLYDHRGGLLAKNGYADVFHHPDHPKGHPSRMSHELGMRLYWA